MKHRCTLRRAEEVITCYKEEIERLGDLATAVTRAYIYERVANRTNLSIRTVSQMRRKNATSGKLEPLEPWTKDKVDEVMKTNGVTLENTTGYDYVFVTNMARADFYKSSLPNEQSLAMFVKDYVDDPDQQDGFIMNRFYADTVRNGTPIPWEEVI